MTDMVNLRKKIFLTYAAVAAALTLVGIVLHTFCLFFFYDADIGYYTRDALPVVLRVICILSVIFFFSAFLTVKPARSELCGREEGTAVRLASVVAAICFALFFVMSIIISPAYSDNSVLELVSKLSALLGVIYFSMNLIPGINRNAQVLCGLGMILWNVYVMAGSYFEALVPLNASLKVMLHLTIISVLLFMVNEFYAFLSCIRPRTYLFTLCLASFFSGVYSIPALLYKLLGQAATYEDVCYDIVYLALFVYFASRLICLARFGDKAVTDVSDATGAPQEFSDSEENEISEAIVAEKETDNDDMEQTL